MDQIFTQPPVPSASTSITRSFSGSFRSTAACSYTALVEDAEYSPIRPLIDWLDYNGYTMVTKPTKEFTDSSGRRKVKGNMDIELAIDVMEMAERVDHIILFSGDGDFRRLVEAVQRKGVRVSVVSTVRSNPPMVADELRRQADSFIELMDIEGEIARKHQGPRRDDRQERFAGPDDFDDEDEVEGEGEAEVIFQDRSGGRR